MSSSTVFSGQFGHSAQNPRWQPDSDDVPFAVLNKDTDSLAVVWDLASYMAPSESISSVAFSDSGATTSSTSNTGPKVLFTITGIGETEVTATLSTGLVVTQKFRTYLANAKRRRDYGLV